VHILHVYKDYPPVIGGIEHHVRALAEAQVAQGHAVTVLVTHVGQGGTTATDEGGVRVIRARRLATVASTPLSVALVRQLVRLAPDLTHLHSPYPVGEAGWLLGGRTPMVLGYHSDIVRQRVLGALWAPFLRRVLVRAERILVGSPNYARSSPFLRAHLAKVDIVPYGIDPERFAGSDRFAARARYSAEAGRTLVFVGRLRYYKGLHVLIAALAALPGVRLLVAGSGSLAGSLAEQAAAAGVADRIAWLGDVPDAELPLVLAAGDLYVLPAVARSESFGIALAEALAAGLPAVTTEVGTGTSWVNLDGVTGRVVPPDDPQALAAAIRAILADEPARAAMGAAARARALSEFTAETMVGRVGRIYTEVCDQAGGSSRSDNAGDIARSDIRDEART
jgi:glycosyltransferase involved in cell wall biosynthesis